MLPPRGSSPCFEVQIFINEVMLPNIQRIHFWWTVFWVNYYLWEFLYLPHCSQPNTICAAHMTLKYFHCLHWKYSTPAEAESVLPAGYLCQQNNCLWLVYHCCREWNRCCLITHTIFSTHSCTHEGKGSNGSFDSLVVLWIQTMCFIDLCCVYMHYSLLLGEPVLLNT